MADHSDNETVSNKENTPSEKVSNEICLPVGTETTIKAIIAWSEPNKSIELSREDIEAALRSKRIKNGFTLARFNNILLKDQLADILTKVDSTIVLIAEEIRK